MKKTVLMLVFSFIMIGCSFTKEPKDILISRAEEELKKSMHDPYSYEFVSFEEDLQKEAEEKLKNEELKIEPEYQSNPRYYKLTYRGKNKFGALILNEIHVVASDDKDLFFLRLED